jgi:Type III restriction enzyme, res subunit/Helicase C-terminal domain
VFIALNTGAGKTLVGLLIAQSLVNEGVENVTYLCGTNDLVLQTYREAEKFRGTIDCTLRTGSTFSNSLFETGKGFCITNYASLFNGLSALQRNHFPGAVIFDDAHVAERMIRESFTLKITSSSHSDLFKEIKSLFEPHFKEVGKFASFEDIIDSPFQSSIMASPSAVRERSERLYTLLVDSGIRNDDNLKYPFNHLKDNLVHCSVVFDYGAVEIAPPFLPLFSLPVFSRNIRRLYLSASLNYKSDIARAFGRIPNLCIEPKNDAGNGERLVLFAEELSKKKVDTQFVESLSQKHKVLIAVPSSRQADTWKAVGIPPTSKNFSEKLQEFREASSGMFILVSRVDGIDLPHETCRIMILDELPKGASLLEQFQWDVLDMKNFRAAKVSNQIIQLFGRINRGRNDYGAFIINRVVGE